MVQVADRGAHSCLFLFSSILLLFPYERISCPCWVQGFYPLCPDPFPLLVLPFSHMFSFPYESLQVGGFTLCASIPFLFFALLTCLSFFSLTLALMCADLAVAGIMYLNNIYTYLFIYLFIIMEQAQQASLNGTISLGGLKEEERQENTEKQE